MLLQVRTELQNMRLHETCCSPMIATNEKIIGCASRCNNKPKENEEDNERPLSLVSAIFGACSAFPVGDTRGTRTASSQIVELQGVRFIGLGSVTDELSPRERVFDTLEQLTAKTDRLISVGYLLDSSSSPRKVTETVPLDVWNNNYPYDRGLSREIKKTIERIQKREYETLTGELISKLATQLSNPNRGSNKFLSGITAHNLGVIKVLSGRGEEAEPYFRQAISLKEAAFGQHYFHEIALSCGELGIQLFAKGDFEAALISFRKAHDLEVRQCLNSPSSSTNPNIAMMLNNIACCDFQMGNRQAALNTLKTARAIQHEASCCSAQADRDLLDVATVIGNCGYLNIVLKIYEEAQSLLEEALLIQQSVLDDAHRAIRDTRSNIEFTNAFHSLD